MVWPVLAAAGAGLFGSWLGNRAQQKAASSQMEFQTQALDWQKQQYGEDVNRLTEFQKLVGELTSPYTDAGAGAIEQQQALSGLLGPEAQQQAYDQVASQPGFLNRVQMGEDAILSNASATGGLRGGNIQASLAQFRPQMLEQEINQRYNQLGGIAGMGLQGAQLRSSVPFTVGAPNIAPTIIGQGQIAAGKNLAQGNMIQQLLSTLGKAGGYYAGQQGWGGLTPESAKELIRAV